MSSNRFHNFCFPLLRKCHRTIAGLLPIEARRNYLYAIGQRRLPDLETPALFSEKVNWRILRDRRPLLEWTCDKLQMRAYAEQFSEMLELRLPTLLWSGSALSEVVGLEFGRPWVLKPNHRSGVVHFGSADSAVDAALVDTTRSWLRDDQGVKLGEWAYSQAARLYLIEENIAPGQDLRDYKFFMFDGEPAAIQVDTNRFTGHRRAFYSPEWAELDVMNRFPRPERVERPSELSQMLDTARALSKGFDFIRVDLYEVDGDVWFGEMTPYPGGGVEPFRPMRFDKWLGAKWSLPNLVETS